MWTARGISIMENGHQLAKVVTQTTTPHLTRMLDSSVGVVNIWPRIVHFAGMSKMAVIGAEKGISTGLAHARKSGLHENIRWILQF